MRHRTLVFLWVAAAGFVLSLGRVGRLHPFGVAFFFSCLGLGPAQKAAAALGVVAGAAFATPGPSAVMVLATVAAGWAVALGPPGWLRGRSAGWLAGPAVVAARLAGAGPSWSAPPLWWLETAVEGALAGLLVPLWSSLLGGLAGRGQGPARPAEQAGPLPGGADALAGWLTMVCGVALGLQGLAVGPVQPAAVAAPLGVMFTAWGLGPGLAASAGALAGWAMALADGRWTLYGLALAAAGGVAGWVGRPSRAACGSAVVLAVAAACMTAPSREWVLWAVGHAGTAALLFLAMPGRWMAGVERAAGVWLAGVGGLPGAQRAAEELWVHQSGWLRQRLRRVLDGLAELVLGLAAVYETAAPAGAMAGAAAGAGVAAGLGAGAGVGAGSAGGQSGGPPGSTYAERVYGRVCETCPSAVHCWQTHGQETFWEVLEFVDACRERQQRGGDEPTPMPQRLAARCIQPGRLAGAVEEVARLAAVEQWALATLQRAYRRVQAELWAVGSVLKESREAALQELGPGDGQAAARIRRHLRRYGAPAPWAWVLGQGGRREVHVGWGGPCGAAGRCVQLACRAVQEVEGVPHSPVGGTCWAGREGAGPGAGAGAGPSGAGCTVVLAPRPTLGAEVAFAGRTCAGQEVSGDRFLRAELGPAVVAVVLSDGMGHGPEACRESEAAVRLVEQALRTGADTRAAIRCANAALLARSAEERFATLDVAVVDLAAGQLELAKAGAYPSFLWRAGQLERLEGRALPAGIMEAVEVEVVRRPLADGDLLVMVTDGAAQLGPAAEACIAEVAEALARADPRQGARVLAEGIVEALGALAPQGWPDDVTVAVLQVRELDGGNGASYSGSGWVRPARAQEEGKQHHRRAAVARV